MSSYPELSCAPKTPQASKGKSAAINKSLLTPCRRIGLAKRSPSTVLETRSAGAENELFLKENIKKSDSISEGKANNLYRYTPLNKRHKITERFKGHSKVDNLSDKFSKDLGAVEGEISLVRASSGNCVVGQEFEAKSGIENSSSYSDSENSTDYLCTPHKRFKSSARKFIGICRGKNLVDLDVIGDVTNNPDVKEEENMGVGQQQSNDLVLNLSVGVLNENTVSISGIHSLEMNTKEYPTSEIMPSREGVTKESLEALRLRVRRKQDEVEELKLAQLYKRKHDLKRLIDLTERWCKGCQEALQELRDVSEEQGCQMTIQQLLEKLGIPNHLVRYDNDLEEFL